MRSIAYLTYLSVPFFVAYPDNTIWTIKLFERTESRIEIDVNNIFLGTFLEKTIPSRNNYVAKFEKMIRNSKKHKHYYSFIQDLSEPRFH